MVSLAVGAGVSYVRSTLSFMLPVGTRMSASCPLFGGRMRAGVSDAPGSELVGAESGEEDELKKTDELESLIDVGFESVIWMEFGFEFSVELLPADDDELPDRCRFDRLDGPDWKWREPFMALDCA